MTVRPILFSAPMIRALLEGRKTQTRRLAKFVTRAGANLKFSGLEPECLAPGQFALTSRGAGGCWNERTHVLKTYASGDLLWVRERAHYAPNRVAYSADNPPLANGEKVDGWGPMRPSIHMPRWASRLTLEVTGVKVERLQDISAGDAVAEGIYNQELGWNIPPPHRPLDDGYCDPRECYADLIESINGAGTWDRNPWIVAVTFRVHLQNVDAFLAQRTTKATEAAA